MLEKKERETSIKMKKIIFGAVIFVLIGLTASWGLLDARFRYDDISEQEYQIPLTKAAMIFKKATNQTKVQMIEFSPQENIQQPTNTTFDYLFVSSDKVVAINPTTGKTVTHSLKTNDGKKDLTFDIEETSNIKLPQTAMKEAVQQCGKRDAKAKSWCLLTKKGKLYYEIKLSEDDEDHILLIRA